METESDEEMISFSSRSIDFKCIPKFLSPEEFKAVVRFLRIITNEIQQDWEDEETLVGRDID